MWQLAEVEEDQELSEPISGAIEPMKTIGPDTRKYDKSKGEAKNLPFFIHSGHDPNYKQQHTKKTLFYFLASSFISAYFGQSVHESGR